jgi:hypothetical protein
MAGFTIGCHFDRWRILIALNLDLNSDWIRFEWIGILGMTDTNW